MTMQQVLEAIRGLDERFEAQDERLAALERETGMADPATTTTTRPRRKL